MGCGSGCSPAGCGNKGHCASGGCNKMNTYDWISTLEFGDPTEYSYAEVNFKNGARKDFFYYEQNTVFHLGDQVVVESATGFDIGQVGMKGELVRLQMKKKGVSESNIMQKIIRKAHERDLEKLMEARAAEHESMVKARVIARTMGLDMKLGDVEYQADMRKATFYYTAEGRVDFRELVKVYAKEFKVKIEMRQIGSRQESARIGGLGSCGRELCCSTWLSDFKSVTTTVARYQNIAINQTKLSGQCGRLKCCLNYELDTYLDALKTFPENADVLKTKRGYANLVKTDIFKGLLFYAYSDDNVRGVFIPITKEKVKEIQALNKKGIFPEDLVDFTYQTDKLPEEEEIKFADVTGEIELPNEKRRRNKKNKRPSQGSGSGQQSSQGNNDQQGKRDDRQVLGPRRADNAQSSDKPRSAEAPRNTDRPKQQQRPQEQKDRSSNNDKNTPKPGGTTDNVKTPDQQNATTQGDKNTQGGDANKKNKFRKFKNRNNKNRPPKAE